MPTHKTTASAAPAAPAKAAKVAKAAKAAKVVKTPKSLAPAKKPKPAVKPAAKALPKPAAKAAAKPAAAALKAARPREKLVRDSFTMPQADFVLIDALKLRALGFKRPTKKSELLRAGLQALAAMPPEALQAALGQLVPLKTGRPKKGG